MNDMGGFSRCFMRILFLVSFILLENLVSFQTNMKAMSPENNVTNATGKEYRIPSNLQNSEVKSWSPQNQFWNFISRDKKFDAKMSPLSTKRKRSTNEKRKKIRPVSDDDTDVSEDKLKEMAAETYGSPCVTNPCFHEGTCVWRKNSIPSFVCKCRMGYMGARCDQTVPECDAGPCKDRGDCVATKTGFMCICKDGYNGKYCEIRKTGAPSTQEKTETVQIVVTKEQMIEGEYIAASVVGTIIVIIIIVTVHCCRVNIRRERQKIAYEQDLADDKKPTSLPPGIMDVSNQLCMETFCCASSPVDTNIEAKVKRKKSKHHRKASKHSKAQIATEPQASRLMADAGQNITSRYSLTRNYESERLLAPSRPDIPTFHSVTASHHYPQKQYSSFIQQHYPEDPRESESNRLLPQQRQRSVPQKGPIVSEALLSTHRVSSDRLANPHRVPSDQFRRPGVEQYGFGGRSRNSLPEYDPYMFSQHSIHSEPSRNQPPLPPPPPIPPFG